MSPRFVGDVDCMLLLNYRAGVEELERVLPTPFHPVEVDDGVGLGGVCAATMDKVRHAYAPEMLGLDTENACHRIAVAWKEEDEVLRGSYVVRRDVEGRLKAFAESARLSGEVSPARITVDFDDEAGRYWLRADCDTEFVRLEAEESEGLDDGSVFSDPESIVEVFEDAEVGYSGTPGSFEAVEACCGEADIRPLDVEKARSSFFEKLGAEFDSALAMVDAEQEVSGKDRLKAP